MIFILRTELDKSSRYLVKLFFNETSFKARIEIAFNAAFIAPLLPTAKVETGIPLGICTIERSESSPELKEVGIGTPKTGKIVIEASMTILPVLGVPIPTSFNSGLDSLLSIVQMPKGIPVSTFAVGKSGAINAALNAISILALNDVSLKKSLTKYREDLSNSVLRMKIT